MMTNLSNNNDINNDHILININLSTDRQKIYPTSMPSLLTALPTYLNASIHVSVSLSLSLCHSLCRFSQLYISHLSVCLSVRPSIHPLYCILLYLYII